MGNLKVDYGDRVAFGDLWCEYKGFDEFVGKTYTMVPVMFECDNGLYAYYVTYPGIRIEEYDVFDEDGSFSVYHLFGNDFEDMMDCSVVKASVEVRSSIIEKHKQRLNEEADAYTAYYENLENDRLSNGI